MDKIEKFKVKIDKITITNNELSLLSSNGVTFKSHILKGSIGFQIFNESNQEVNFGNLEEGEIIKIYGNRENIKDAENLNSNSDEKKVSQKNNIIIKKIIIKNRYVFNSDSSDDLENIDDFDSYSLVE